MGLILQQQFTASISTLRKCGFFEQYSSMTDAQAATALLEWLHQQTPQDAFYQAHPEFSFDKALLRRVAEGTGPDTFKEIASYDFARVWSGDLEADVMKDNDIYVGVVEQYARLSMGCLQPTNIVETWASETGPVTLSFEQYGQQFTTQLAYYDDWIDGEVFSFLDAAMKSQGFTSSIHAEVDTGQDVFLVRANEEEKACMERELGWSFDWQPLMGEETE
ncbi:hypothetical protein [Hymenobacter cyanobacteriorum]|nr:hypothetical protein [Hymenobacter cyanobacteriorum]